MYNCNHNINLLRVCLLEILVSCVLTSSTLDSAYKHVSGIHYYYLKDGIEWCVMWSLYVGMLIAKETHT